MGDVGRISVSSSSSVVNHVGSDSDKACQQYYIGLDGLAPTDPIWAVSMGDTWLFDPEPIRPKQFQLFNMYDSRGFDSSYGASSADSFVCDDTRGFESHTTSGAADDLKSTGSASETQGQTNSSTSTGCSKPSALLTWLPRGNLVFAWDNEIAKHLHRSLAKVGARSSIDQLYLQAAIDHTTGCNLGWVEHAREQDMRIQDLVTENSQLSVRLAGLQTLVDSVPGKLQASLDCHQQLQEEGLRLKSQIDCIKTAKDTALDQLAYLKSKYKKALDDIQQQRKMLKDIAGYFDLQVESLPDIVSSDPQKDQGFDQDEESFHSADESEATSDTYSSYTRISQNNTSAHIAVLSSSAVVAPSPEPPPSNMMLKNTMLLGEANYGKNNPQSSQCGGDQLLDSQDAASCADHFLDSPGAQQPAGPAHHKPCRRAGKKNKNNKRRIEILPKAAPTSSAPSAAPSLSACEATTFTKPCLASHGSLNHDLTSSFVDVQDVAHFEAADYQTINSM